MIKRYILFDKKKTNQTKRDKQVSSAIFLNKIASVRHTTSGKNKHKQMNKKNTNKLWKEVWCKMLTMHIVQFIPHLFEYIYSKSKQEAVCHLYILLFLYKQVSA